jgi:hypothetical protein
MGIKTTLNHKGMFSERVDGADSFHLNVSSHKEMQSFTGSGSFAITKPVAVFEGTTANVTGTLPAISDLNVGLEVCVINADINENIQVSASNPIDLATYVYTVPEESATFLAISSSTGYGWIVTHVKA